jgi:hypothetical protein
VSQLPSFPEVTVTVNICFTTLVKETMSMETHGFQTIDSKRTPGYINHWLVLLSSSCTIAPLELVLYVVRALKMVFPMCARGTTAQVHSS